MRKDFSSKLDLKGCVSHRINIATRHSADMYHSHTLVDIHVLRCPIQVEKEVCIHLLTNATCFPLMNCFICSTAVCLSKG